MQIATWNVNSLKVRLPQVLDWLQSSNCDTLTLQELKLDNPFFPIEAFKEIGYNCAFNGQKTYNGVAIISRHTIEDIVYDIPNYPDIQKRVISATVGGVRLICVYVVNGESIDSEKYKYKLLWLEHLHNYIKANLLAYNKLAILGDFNIAPQDIDVYDPEAWQGKVLCSIPEREKWKKLLELGLHDSFRIFNQEDKHYTWWDYRNFAFRRKLGLRIDHILISDGLKKETFSCTIDVNPRKNERPSDHTPVILHTK
ncbi:MAG: xth [Burkholderiales bacterium]|jgi:exodeoxyribonuclease-3|nr:xth [Burkholderiales bacterium]MCE3267956.1 xth [Burkholderiales bacterium]